MEMDVKDIIIFFYQMIRRFIDWMFITPLGFGFSIGTVVFGTTIIVISVEFASVLLRKQLIGMASEKDGTTHDNNRRSYQRRYTGYKK